MSLPIPEKEHNDIVDLLMTAAKKPVKKLDENGNEITELEIDPNEVWWKLHNIDSNYFGRYAKTITEFANLSVEAFNFMDTERANTLGNEILRSVEAHHFAINAKSSETSQDPHNNKKNVIHILTRNEIHKKFTVKDEVSRSGVRAFLSGERNEPG